jgi:outer membrane receptor protein involved in Fe transport
MTSVTKSSFLVMGTSLILGMTKMAAAQNVPAETTAAAEEEVQQVVVTGTLIKQQRDLNSPVPITSVSPDVLQSTGTLEIVQAFRNLPEFGSNSAGTETNIGGGGAQSLDLRNLGAQRTLTLVNGRRMSTFNDAVGNSGAIVDVGMIPKSLIARVDVERDGAGPTYGSDAVAGVVNFILDENFRGFNVDGSYGVSDERDGQSWRVVTKLGFSNDKGGLVVGADWSTKQSINADARDWSLNQVTSLSSKVIRNTAVGPGGIIYAANGTTVLACYPNAGGASVAPACPYYDLNGAGLYTLNTGSTIRDVGALGHYNFNDSVTFKGQVFYTRRDNTAPIGSYSLNTTATFGNYIGGFSIPAASSNNPFGQDVRLKWLTLSAGGNTQRTDVSQLWSTFGLTGTIANRWNWEVLQTNSRTASDQQYTAYPIASHIRNLFVPTLCAADPLCAPVGAIGNLDTFFSTGGELTQAQAGYGWYTQLVTTTYDVQESTATISGPVFTLPSGDVQAAVGAEYRRITGSQLSDSVSQTLDAARSVILPWNQGYATREAYAEIQIPLLKDVPFARNLDLNLQARRTSFDAVNTSLDTATTWKAGLSYAPSDDIRFRAALGTSFRAPTPFDLYRGGNLSLNTGTDPCDPTGIRQTNATVNQNCIAAGAPTGVARPSNLLTVVSGGSPSLQPEQGRSFTVGTVFTPTFASNLSMTLDYYHVTLTNAIGTTNLTQALQTCYSDPNFAARVTDPSDSCFGYNTRNPDQSLGRINLYAINVSRRETDGFDYSGHYQLRSLGAVPGRLSFDARVSLLKSFYDTNVVIGEERGTFGFPKWNGTLTATYQLNPFSFSWMTRYLSAMKDQGVLRGSIPANNPLGYDGTGSYAKHDVTVRWQGASESKPYVELGINNVFDKDPPFAFGSLGNRNTLGSTFDVIGRYFYVNAGYRF